MFCVFFVLQVAFRRISIKLSKNLSTIFENKKYCQEIAKTWASERAEIFISRFHAPRADYPSIVSARNETKHFLGQTEDPKGNGSLTVLLLHQNRSKFRSLTLVNAGSLAPTHLHSERHHGAIMSPGLALESRVALVQIQITLAGPSEIVPDGSSTHLEARFARV